jgi:hypothetical protein
MPDSNTEVLGPAFLFLYSVFASTRHHWNRVALLSSESTKRFSTCSKCSFRTHVKRDRSEGLLSTRTERGRTRMRQAFTAATLADMYRHWGLVRMT